MAEKRRSRRVYRRAISVLSLAGTTTAVWAATGLAGDGSPARGGGPDPGGVEVAGTRVAALQPLTLSTRPGHARADGPLSVLPEAPRGSTTTTSNVASTPLVGERPPPSAPAPPPAPARVATPEAVGHAALARIGYPWQSVLGGWKIEFLGGRSGLLGGTWTYEKRIEIYVRAGHTVEEVAFTLAHEVGHAVDVTLLTEAERERWRAARGISAEVPWWVESGATDFSSCSGDWAEAFAVWLVGGWSHSRLAGQPTPAQLTLLAELAR